MVVPRQGRREPAYPQWAKRTWATENAASGRSSASTTTRSMFRRALLDRTGYRAPAMRSAPVIAAMSLAAVLVADSSGQGRAGPIDLVGKVGMKIVGGTADDRVGWSVARAGDVNGDRRPDVIIGAPTAGYNAREASGSAYVVFGQRSAKTIDLASLGSAGFRIDGAEVGDAAGFAVSTAGDA